MGLAWFVGCSFWVGLALLGGGSALGLAFFGSCFVALGRSVLGFGSACFKGLGVLGLLGVVVSWLGLGFVSCWAWLGVLWACGVWRVGVLGWLGSVSRLVLFLCGYYLFNCVGVSVMFKRQKIRPFQQSIQA